MRRKKKEKRKEKKGGNQVQKEKKKSIFERGYFYQHHEYQTKPHEIVQEPQLHLQLEEIVVEFHLIHSKALDNQCLIFRVLFLVEASGE